MDTSKIDITLKGFAIDQKAGTVSYTIELGLPSSEAERASVAATLKNTSMAQMLRMFREQLESMPDVATEEVSSSTAAVVLQSTPLMQVCRECGGSGVFIPDCEDCGGTGDTCASCAGTGQRADLGRQCECQDQQDDRSST